MPWKGRALRPNRDGSSRRHSTIEIPKRAVEPFTDQNPLVTASKDSSDIRSIPATEQLPTKSRQRLGLSDAGIDEDSEPQSAPIGGNKRPGLTMPNKSHRFSLMRLRHASDPQLSTTYAAAESPPVPNAPSTCTA